MSIELNLKTLAENSTRIADALETLVSKLSHIDAAVQAEAPAQPAAPQAPVAPTPPVAEQPAPTPPAAPQAPAAPAAPAQPATAPVAPAAPAAAPAMTPEELNNALVVEFQRLSGRDQIDAAIRELGATTITDLPAEHYQSLLAKVQAIPA